MLNGFLKQSFMGNTVLDYAQAVGTVAAGILIVWIIKIVVLNRLKKWSAATKSGFDDYILSAVEKYLVPLVYFGLIYLGLNGLHLNPGIQKGLSSLSSVLVTVVGILFLRSLIQFVLFNVYVKRRPDAALVNSRFQMLMPALTAAIWVIGCMFLLDNLGFKISAIMAGLGIGGVAVALASSAVLGDLFAYFVIMFDRPFVIGDFIIVGDFLGSVEHIGIKSTRLRSLGGELLVFSNKDLTDSRIRNYKVMDLRRVVFKLGVVYGTPLDVLKEVPGLIKKIIEGTPDTRFDRAHFYSYGDFSLIFEVVYYVLSADYNKYMDVQQAINFAIKGEFDKRGIEFAFPTQTLHVQGFPSGTPSTSIESTAGRGA